MNTLGNSARLAVVWNAGFALFRGILQFGLTLVLARLLTAQEYGQSGLVSSMIGFVMIFSFRSFLLHALQTRRETEADFQLHFTAGAVIQSSLFVITNLLALGLRWVPAYEEITPLLHVASMVILLDGASEIRVKMLERTLDWKRLRLLHGLGVLISAILALGLAFGGAGVWALVVSSLFKCWPFIYDLFVVQRWIPEWFWDRKKFAAAWRFGLARLGSGMAQYGRPLLESLILVHLVGYTWYGLYGRAVGLTQFVCEQFASALLQAIYPVLTKIEPDTHAYGRVSGLVLRCISWVIIPAGTLLAILADPVVQTIYGERWLEVAPLLPWAIMAGGIGAITHAVYILLLADQQQRRCLMADLWILVGTAASLWWLLPLGIPAYLLGVTLTQSVALVATLYWLCHERLSEALNALGALIRPAGATFAALLFCEWVRHWGGIQTETFGPAAAYGVGFTFIYLVVVRLLFARLLRELVSFFPARNYLSRLLLLGQT